MRGADEQRPGHAEFFEDVGGHAQRVAIALVGHQEDAAAVLFRPGHDVVDGVQRQNIEVELLQCRQDGAEMRDLMMIGLESRIAGRRSMPRKNSAAGWS